MNTSSTGDFRQYLQHKKHFTTFAVGEVPPLPMPAGARAHPVFIDFLLGRNKYVFCPFTDALSMVACHDLANGVLPTVRYLTEEPNNLFPYLCI